MMRVTLYTKADCSLCDQVKVDLQALHEEIPHQLVEVDIQSDAALLDLYGERVPIVMAGPYTLEAPISAMDLKVALGAARDRMKDQKSSERSNQAWGVRLNRLVLGLTRRWLTVINLFVLLYLGLPFLAPVLMKVGATRPAGWLYTAYSPLCHQLGYRTWYVFGEQAAYPSEKAGLSAKSFEEATGLPASDYRAARAFVGDERLGYKVALCQRDVGIYGSMLLGGMIFGLFRRHIKPIPTWVWFVVGILPVALDGGTQLLANLPFFSTFLPARESTPLLRSITGGLFGVMNVWLAYPYVEESMAETRAQVLAKLAGAAQSASSPE